MHAIGGRGGSKVALPSGLTRCGADAQSDQETVEMLMRLELLTERLSRRQPDTPSSSLSIQDVLTELDTTLEQPGKGGHTLAQVVISNAIWLRLEGQDSGNCPAVVLVWLGVRVLSRLAALCRPSCRLDSTTSGRGNTAKQDYLALADMGLGAALTAALHASVAAAELGVSSPGGRRKDDPLLLADGGVGLSEVRGLCLESLLTLVSLEPPMGHKWRTRLGGEGACGALCASLAAEHAQPHHSGSTGDGWAQAADEDEEGRCPGCSSCGGASGSGGQGEGERAVQWARRRSLACRTLAALAYRHADNQHAIREAGGVALVVRELENAGNRNVHGWAVRVVSWLSHNNYRCQDALGTAGALRLLLTQLTIALSAAQPPAAEEGKEKGRGSGQWVVALEEPLDGRARAVAEVLQALANLSFKHYANQDTVRREGGLFLLLKALATHLSTKEVAIHACRCISVLCWSNKANQQGLGRLGAATFIMDAVNTHINTSTPSQQPQGNATKAAWEVPLLVLTCEALDALGRVCWDCPENVASACRANIARAVCDWMRAQLEAPLVQGRGTQLLADLLAWAPQAVLADLQERLRQCGFCALLSSNFHIAVAPSSPSPSSTHAFSATLSPSATLSLSSTLGSSLSSSIADGPGASPASGPGDRDAMLRYCARGISGLTRGENSLNRDVLGDAGACEFVCRVLASGGTDWALRVACLEALACLAAHHSRNQDTLLAHGAARLLLLPSLCPPLPPPPSTAPPSEERTDGPLPLSLCTTSVTPAALLHAQRLVAVAALAGEHTRAQDALSEACAELCHVCVALSSCPHVQLQALKAAAALACDHHRNQELLLESGVSGVLHRVLSQCGSDSPLLASALSLMVALLHQPSTPPLPFIERSSSSVSSPVSPPSSPRPYQSSSPSPSFRKSGSLGLHVPLSPVQLLCQGPSACVSAMCTALASARHPRDVWLYACAAISLLGRSERRLTCPLLLGPECHAIETVLLPALRLFPGDAWIQAEALDALANLAPAATPDSTAALLHTVPMVVAALRDPAPTTPTSHANNAKTSSSMQNHPRLLVRACLSIALIANHAPACQSALHESGAASALCRLLSRCNSQQDGLGNACGPSSGTSLLSHVVKTITNLSRKHAGNQDALIASGACVELCQSVAGVLNASRASSSGSVPWVLLVQLLGALHSLSNGCVAAQDALGEADGCALVCEALFRAAAPKSSASLETQDESRLQVQLQGLSCVMAMARGHAGNQARMGEAGAGARVCEALSSCGGVPAVQVQAFQAMYALAWGCTRNQEYLGLAGAHGLVCDVLREALSEEGAGPAQVEVAFYANKALSTLAYKCPANQHRLRKAGACVLLLIQLTRWSKDAQGSVVASPCVDSRRALALSQASMGGRGLLSAVLEAATALTKQCPENVQALGRQPTTAQVLQQVIAQCEAMGEARGGDLQRRTTALYKTCCGEVAEPRGVVAA